MGASRSCAVCGASLEGRRRSARTCGPRCRKALSRLNQQSWVRQRSVEYRLPEKDFWRTPPALFEALDSEFRFTLDAATSGPDDALCVEWLTPDEDALSCTWPAFLHLSTGKAAAFCNPPYSTAGGGLFAWVRACLRARALQTVVLVAPAEVSSGWFHLANRKADEIRLLKKRVRFVPPPGLRSSSPRGGTLIAIFREGGTGPARVVPSWEPNQKRDSNPPGSVTPRGAAC